MKNDIEKMRHELKHGSWEEDKAEFVPETLQHPDPEMIDGGGCDLLIIIGPSLNVQPYCRVANQTTKGCPQVVINQDNNVYNPEYDFEDLLNFPNRLFLKGGCN